MFELTSRRTLYITSTGTKTRAGSILPSRHFRPAVPSHNQNHLHLPPSLPAHCYYHNNHATTSKSNINNRTPPHTLVSIFAMTSVAELLPKTKKLAFELQSQVRQVELGYVSPDNVFMGLSELERQIGILNTLVGQERPGAREQWRRKISELGNEAMFLRTVLDRFLQSRGRVVQEAKEREELLARRYGRGQGGETPTIVVDQLMEEGASYQRSGAMMNDILMSGQATLSNLLDQRSSLKSARKKVLDVLSLLGVSSRIMGMAERRDAVDKVIVVGGMCVTLVVLWVCWKAVSGEGHGV